VAVPEIGYFADFESDEGGWEAAGWARIRNVLPQFYRLALISMGEKTTIEYIDPGWDNSAVISLQIGGDTDEVILVVSGTTRHTRQKAPYWLEIRR
jgi:immune inhibitor A